jgi:hypothetical protein
MVRDCSIAVLMIDSPFGGVEEFETPERTIDGRGGANSALAVILPVAEG